MTGRGPLAWLLAAVERVMETKVDPKVCELSRLIGGDDDE